MKNTTTRVKAYNIKTVLAGFLLLIMGLPLYAGAQDYSIEIAPKDTTVKVGEQVQFQAQLVDTSGTETDTSFSWSVSDSTMASITDDGLLTADNPGFGFVTASVGDLSENATIIVQDSTTDTTGVQTITVVKPRPNSKAPNDTTVIEEGDLYKLSGFRHPFHLLNGGLVHFPLGSLTENVTLLIELPDFATIKDDTVQFPENIANGVSFHIKVDDSVRSPYAFEQPLTVAIPYKRGVIHNQLGISVDQLGMFFYDSETELDSTGISNITVDSLSNRIFAHVAHFSDVVLAPSEQTTDIDSRDDTEMPRTFNLSQNYPNPFNPTTQISYTLPGQTHVTLEVYNVLGHKVATLVDKEQQSGEHTVTFDASKLSSGIYLYKLHTPKHTAVRKMTLIK